MNKEAENRSYWDKIYKTREPVLFDPLDWRNAASLSFIEKINSLIKPSDRILEIGGGGGQISCYLAKKNPDTSFTVIDFSREGCLEAEKLSKQQKIPLEVIDIDFFSQEKSLADSFEMLFSLGVAEHFSDLPSTIKSMAFYLKQKGKIFTLIPNMASPVYSYLCGKWNRKVLETHILYDLAALRSGHEKAGFKILDSGYIYPVEFSILSMAFSSKTPEKLDWFFFLWLTRLSKIIHLLYRAGIKLPASRLFSPYIFVIGEKVS